MRTIEQHIHCHASRHTPYTRSQIRLDRAISPLRAFILHAFLIVAFAIGDITIFVRIAQSISVFQPSHSQLAVCIIGVIPAQHTGIHKSRAIRTHIVTPMLENHITIRSDSLKTCVIVLQVGHGIIHIPSAETMAKVKTIAIHLILLHPILDGTLEHLMCRSKIMIPVLAIVVITMFHLRSQVKPRVETQFRFRLLAAGPRIEFRHRVIAVGMVEHHIHDNRHTMLVALVDELLNGIF